MSKKEAFITIRELKDLLRLDEHSGRLYWLPRSPHHFAASKRISSETRGKQWNRLYACKEAFFTADTNGYLHGFLKNTILSTARVVFAMHTGSWPQQHIDHINGIKTDNRPINLRDVSRANNMRNRALSSNSTTGINGVSFHAGKYDAYVTDDGKKRHLGRFDDISSAVATRHNAEKQLGYHDNHGRRQS